MRPIQLQLSSMCSRPELADTDRAASKSEAAAEQVVSPDNRVDGDPGCEIIARKREGGEHTSEAAAEQVVHDARGLAVHRQRHLAVDIKRDRDRRLAEHLWRDLRMDAAAQQQVIPRRYL